MFKFFRIPFANLGDKTTVPDAADPSGNVSYTEGYGFDYQRPTTDPEYKDVERDKMNSLFNEFTTAIAELQSQGIPDFITTALNGGTPYSYAANAVVRYSGTLYLSLVGGNTALPTDPTKWAPLPTPDLLQHAAYTSAVAGGTANAITATFSPAVGALPAAPAGLTLLVRAGAANTAINPTFSPDGLTAKTIVKGNNLPLVAGDITGPGHWLQLQFDASLDRWVLLNPANSPQMRRGSGTTSGGTGTITFSTPFPNACRQIIITENSAGGWTPSNLTVYGSDNKTVNGATVKSLSWTGGAFAAASGSFDYVAWGD